MADDRPVLTLAHSPDPDDAFMWRGLGHVGERGSLTPSRDAEIDTGRFRFRVVAHDIETLNRRAVERGDLDCTAMSFHVYPHVKGRYALTTCGASMGEGYGPKVVARDARPPEWLRTPGLRIATPGQRTTAHLTLRLLLGQDFVARETPFEKIITAVGQGDADAGIVIHEGQLTYPDAGLQLVVDLGAWWTERTGLPLPLGANAIRRDLDERFGDGAAAEVAGVLKRSIEHAMANRASHLEHAAGYGRGISPERNDEFVRMYVNDLTLDVGERGREAVRRLLTEAHEQGLAPDPEPIEWIGPATP
jgi:1,4-dihydroxy-6-naphthoate synthase